MRKAQERGWWRITNHAQIELETVVSQAEPSHAPPASLLGEFSKAAALAGAQRAFIASARTAQPYRVHPYFWGAFHLIGDDGPLLR